MENNNLYVFGDMGEPLVTEEEYHKLADSPYRWVARDGEDGPVYAFTCKPQKVGGTLWVGDGEYKCIGFSDDFTFIKWWEEEPVYIPFLLANYRMFGEEKGKGLGEESRDTLTYDEMLGELESTWREDIEISDKGEVSLEMKKDTENQVTISDEEYYMLESILERGCLWLARDEDNGLWVFGDKPYKYTSTARWDLEENGVIYDVYDHTKFKFVKWEDDEPHYIPALIQDYDMEQLKKGEDNMYTDQKHYTPVEEGNSGTGELKYCEVIFPDDGDRVDGLLERNQNYNKNYRRYEYFTDIFYLNPGDVVAVSTRNGTKIASFVQYIDSSDKANSIVLNRINTKKGQDFYSRRKEKERLEKQIEERIEAVSFLDRANQLAEHDDELKKLIEAYKNS